jgi:hypothetical protein
MIKSNKTKRTGMNIFYIWIQKELPNKFYNINQQDTKTLEDLAYAGKKTSEREQATMAYLEDDDEHQPYRKNFLPCNTNTITLKLQILLTILSSVDMRQYYKTMFAISENY